MLLYLGSIVVPDGDARNNTDTAVPFRIPPSTKAVRLRAGGIGAYVETAKDDEVPSLFVSSSDTGFPMGDPTHAPPGLLGIAPLRLVDGGEDNVIGVYNSSGDPVTLQVWACLPT